MFSNFASFAVEWRGKLWLTSEHAYQAAKFFNPEIVKEVQDARSAHDAKRIAHLNDDQIRPDWDEVKVSIMEDIVRQKLMQHPYILRKLLKTQDLEIVKDSPTDSFWGRGPDGNGQNHLGKIWMKLREEMRLMSQQTPDNLYGGGGGN